MVTKPGQSPEIPALIIGDDPVNVLGAARNLGRLRIPVYRLGADDSGVLRSRYVKSARIVQDLDDCSDEEYLKILEEFSGHIDRRAVIFPLSDIHVLRVSSNVEALSKNYRLRLPGNDAVETLVNKRRFYESLCDFGAPHPMSLYPTSREEYLEAAEKIGYPVFLKPEISPLFAKKFRLKGLVANNPEELSNNYDLLAGSGLEIVLQEIIPGEASCMHGCAGVVSDVDVTTFCYRRVREFPAGFGCGSLMESVEDFSGGTKLLEYLKHIGYRGIFDAEFKKDPRDGQYKIIEINARSWWQNQLPTASGTNVVKAQYDYVIGNNPIPQSYATGILWMHLYNDYHARRAAGVGFVAWLRSLRTVGAFDIWASDDMRPMTSFLSGIIAGKVAKVFRINR